MRITKDKELNTLRLVKDKAINDLRVANLIELKAVQMKLQTLENKTKTLQHARLAKDEIGDVKSILKTRCVCVCVCNVSCFFNIYISGMLLLLIF
jgi:hypothetical protein